MQIENLKPGTFVVLGNMDRRFDRLISMVQSARERLPRPILVQYGYTTPTEEMRLVGAESDMHFIDYLSHTLFREHVGVAELIISHAGVGTLLTCQYFKKIPLMMARRTQYAEHIDDHQTSFIQNAVKSRMAIEIISISDLLNFCCGDLIPANFIEFDLLVDDLRKYLDSCA